MDKVKLIAFNKALLLFFLLMFFVAGFGQDSINNPHFNTAVIDCRSLSTEELIKVFTADTNDVIVLGEMSVRAYMKKDFFTAEKYFRKLAEVSSTDMHAQFYLGECLMCQQKFAEAIPFLEKVVPDSVYGSYSLAHLGRCYHMLFDAKNEKEYFIKALAQLNKNIARDSSDFKNYYLRAIVNMQLYDYRTVLADFDKSISLNANNAMAYCWRGRARKALSNMEGSCEDFYKAVKLHYKEAEGVLCAYCKKQCKEFNKK